MVSTQYIRVFSELSGQMRYAGQKRILVEIALVKLTNPSMEQNMDSVVQRLDIVEKKLEEMPQTLESLAAAIPSRPAGDSEGSRASKESEAEPVFLPK